MLIPWLGADIAFPPLTSALKEPNGLLAVGGDLSPRRLLAAYRHGIFPWYSEGDPILWWSPDPRMVLFPAELRVTRSLAKTLRNASYEVRFDTAFDEVMRGCAAPRDGEPGTWITAEMRAAYGRLHELGYAHSAETWIDGALAGGLYGVAIGRMFFGESMFSGESGSSKLALAALARRLREWGWPWIDAQVENEHTRSLGALRMPRERFLELVSDQTSLPEPAASWTERFGELAAAHLAG